MIMMTVSYLRIVYTTSLVPEVVFRAQEPIEKTTSIYYAQVQKVEFRIFLFRHSMGQRRGRSLDIGIATLICVRSTRFLVVVSMTLLILEVLGSST